MSNRQNITIDPATGKTTTSSGRYSDAFMQLLGHSNDLAERHNALLDHIQLFGDPDVISHLLYGTSADDIAKKPQPIQDAIASIRDLLEQRLTQAKADDKKDTQQALDTLCDELTKQHEQELTAFKAQLTKEHEEQLTAKERELGDMCDTVGMHKRTAIYQRHVARIVNTFLKATKASVPEQGIRPIMDPTMLEGALCSEFIVHNLHISTTVRPVAEDGSVHEALTVSTATGLGLPELRTVVLEARASDTTGLTLEGVQALEQALRALTPEWYNGAKDVISEEGLAQIYVDPDAAREYFEERSRERALGSTALRFAFGMTHRPRPDTITGAGSSTDDLYVLRDRKPSAVQHFAVAAANYWPCGANPASNGTDIKPVDDPDYVHSNHQE